MAVGQFVFVMILNVAVISGLYYFQMHRIEKRLKRLRQEMQQMEDLVVAIVEEFEEAADGKMTKIQTPQTVKEVSPSPATLVTDLSDEKLSAFQALPRMHIPALETRISDPKHHQILTLCQQGLAVAEISERLSIGPSEIRLVLGLYKQGNAQSEAVRAV